MRRFPLISFYILACLITWSVWVPQALAAQGMIELQVPDMMNYIAYYIGPPLAAILVTWSIGGRAATRDLLRRLLIWRVDIRWYLMALFTRIVILILALAVSIALGYMPFSSLDSLGTIAIPALLLNLVGRVFAHSGEEIGWRGFVLPYAQATLGPFSASVIVALLWGAWHVPLFFIPGTVRASSDFVLFLIWLIAISLLHTLLYNNTNGSLFIASLFHASYNTATTHFPNVPMVVDIVITWLVAGVLLRACTPKNMVNKRQSQFHHSKV